MSGMPCRRNIGLPNQVHVSQAQFVWRSGRTVCCSVAGDGLDAVLAAA